MIYLFGTRGITFTQMSGAFHCPSCGPNAPFAQKGVRRFFTFFFIPTIPLDEVRKYVECQRCRQQFNIDVLEWTGGSPITPPPTLPTHSSPSALPALARPSSPPPLIANQRAGMANAYIQYRGNSAATASLVLGIIGLVTSWFICPSIVLVILSIVFGIIGIVKVKNGKGTIAGKGKSIAGISCSVLGLIVIALMFKSVKDAPPSASPAKLSAFQTAESHLSSSSASHGYGNNEQAKELANKLAEMMQSMDAAAFTSKKPSAKSKKYVVHCELRADSCAFLIYVPDYRGFENEAKTALSDIAWSSACMVLSDDGSFVKPVNLAVGLKGVALYGSIMTGSHADKEPRTNTTDQADLVNFFRDVVALPEQAPVAPAP